MHPRVANNKCDYFFFRQMCVCCYFVSAEEKRTRLPLLKEIVCVHFYLCLRIEGKKNGISCCWFSLLLFRKMYVLFFYFFLGRTNNSCAGNEIRKYVKACACVQRRALIHMTLSSETFFFSLNLNDNASHNSGSNKI